MLSLAGRVTRAALAGGFLGALAVGGLLMTWPVSQDELPAPVKKLAPDLTANAQWITNGYDTVELSSTTGIRMLFVGDVMLDRNVAARIKKAKDTTYTFLDLPVGWFNSFDYAVGNLEGPVTDKYRSPKKSIDFKFDPAMLPVLKDQGLDAFSQANNHALDQGSVGYDDSVKRLREAGFIVFGHETKFDETALATTTVNGIRFAFVGYNVTNVPFDVKAAEKTMTLAKSQADRVIVMIHWGTEYHATPDKSVVNLGHWLVDYGADAVIGGHPHWYQGISSYQGKPITWSLGNFIFDQDFSTSTRQGLAVALTFDRDQTSMELFPVQIDKSKPHLVVDDVRQQRLEDLVARSDAELKDQILSGKIIF